MFHYYGAMSDPVASQTASQASREASRAVTQVEQLGFDVERLMMITEALWSILKEQHGYADEELQRRVAEIDMRDGKLDGRVAPTAPVRCEQCDKPLLRKRPRCIYCGHNSPPALFNR